MNEFLARFDYSMTEVDILKIYLPVQFIRMQAAFLPLDGRSKSLFRQCISTLLLTEQQLKTITDLIKIEPKVKNKK